jgi:hypothetical protein
LNAVVIATFIRIRRTDRKLSSGGIHLLILAVSDITFNLYHALGFVLRILTENNLISKNPIFFTTFIAYGRSSGFVNRLPTLFIAVTRARVLYSFRQAHRSLEKTEKDHIRETVCFGVLLPTAILGVLAKVLEITRGISESAAGGCYDWADAELIVIRGPLKGPNDTPFGRPTPALANLSAARGLATLRVYWVFSVTID